MFNTRVRRHLEKVFRGFLSLKYKSYANARKTPKTPPLRWSNVPRALPQNVLPISKSTKHLHVFPIAGDALDATAVSWALNVRKPNFQAQHKTLPQSGEPTLTTEVPAPKIEMTRDQKTVFDLALDGASLFIGGEAGTGKSLLLTAIASALTQKGLRVSVTASTGIAALNIGGNTFHSEFGIPFSTPDDLMDTPLRKSQEGEMCDNEGDEEEDGAYEAADKFENNALVNSTAYNMFSSTRVPQRLKFRNAATLDAVDVIVLDEVSMLHAGFLEALERTLRRTPGRDPRRPFGGVQLILSGDFMQLTPFASSHLPFGFSRRLPRVRMGDAFHSTRKVCRGVQLPPPDPTTDSKVGTESLQRENSSQVDQEESVSSSSPKPSSTAFQPFAPNGNVQQHSHILPRRQELWYYDKPMFESWCFCKFLLHVQLQEPQRQKDATFAADLNELRRGELPFRLSRSALLNPFDKEAVRLFPTKAAVRNFNDRRMLELDGESRVFRTRLTVTDATAAKSHSQRREAEAAGSTKAHACRATLLLQYRLCSPVKGVRRAATLAKKGHLTNEELRRAERKIEKYCKLPPCALQIRTLPVPLSYSLSLSTLSVECSAATGRMAEERRAMVKAALEQCRSQQRAETVPDTSFRELKMSSTSSSLFPRDIVRLESIERSQLLRRLQPAMQPAFRDAIRKDTVLREKTFKVGCRVMLLRNLSTTYVNGSLGTITRYLPVSECALFMPADMKATTAQHLSLLPPILVMKDDQLAFREDTAVLPIVRMDADGKEVAIPWIFLPVPVVHNDWCYVLRATCMPLTPAYAFTVHKIQGVTLDHSVLFDADGMFPCDHLVYVAASRVRKFEQLRIVNLTPGMISVHVPSLNFTNRIPTVEGARRTWDAWRKRPNSTSSFFLPLYMKAQKRYIKVLRPNVATDSEKESHH